ncbi:hypothetical protein J2755_001949 [Methanohalophilus levihalophilus]|uniref:DUF434 domain-containing protein n=1 Tax=Methanohalophilus levihalophilus TaxID=1431282 RepID=UPI001AE4BC2D|nr:DUF434 domain-containing protein [Methanohalophilus levihalophilus]MBP2031001.1 hypothetical protein [Methanohalophilus levihalophilus]
MSGPKEELEILAIAANDFRYLLNKGYPRAGALKFVSDHYRLYSKQRHILNRTVIIPDIVETRKAKKIECDQISGKHLAIDGYNVLIAIETAIEGYKLWISDDGYVRDTRGKFNNFKMTDSTILAIDELIGIISHHMPSKTTILLDRPMSNSGNLAALLREKMEKHEISGEALTSEHVDYDLKNMQADIIATSDGIIIDNVRKVVDIPACFTKSRNVHLNKIPATSG